MEKKVKDIASSFFSDKDREELDKVSEARIKRIGL